MWESLLLLWAVPLLVVLTAAGRLFAGIPLAAQKELRFLFGRPRQGKLSVWFWLAMAFAAPVFFTAGVVEAVVLPNTGGVWAVFLPFLTGALATLLVVMLLRSRLCYRSARRKSRGSPRRRERVAYSPDF